MASRAPLLPGIGDRGRSSVGSAELAPRGASRGASADDDVHDPEHGGGEGECEVHGWRMEPRPDGRAHMSFVTPSERLKAFSDAMYSIIVTIMAVPLSVSEEDADSTVGTIVGKLLLAFGGLVPAFCLTYLFWFTHCRIMHSVEQVDAWIVFSNTRTLIIDSLFPVALQVFQKVHGAAGMVSYGAIVVLHVVAVLLLRAGLVKYSVDGLARVPVAVKVFHFMAAAAVILGAIIIGGSLLVAIYVSQQWAPVCLCLMLLGRHVLNKASSIALLQDAEGARQFRAVEKKWSKKVFVLPKGRAEAFTDGVYGIAATLIVLDIRVATVNAADTAEQTRVLLDVGRSVINYVAAALVILDRWHLHYEMTTHSRGMSRWMTVGHALMCLGIVCVPAAVSFVSIKPSLAAHVVVMIAASLIAFGEWLYMYLGTTTMRPCPDCDGVDKPVMYFPGLDGAGEGFVGPLYTRIAALPCVAGVGLLLQLLGVEAGLLSFLLLIPVRMVQRVWSKRAFQKAHPVG